MGLVVFFFACLLLVFAIISMRADTKYKRQMVDMCQPYRLIGHTGKYVLCDSDKGPVVKEIIK